MSRIDTRVVTPADWRSWRDLRLAALADAPDAFGSRLADWAGADEARWRARLEAVPVNLVLEIDGAPVGMVSLTAPDAEAQVEVISLWVAPQTRGHGVGDEAIRQAVAHAAKRYPRHRVVLSVRPDNRHALALYERHEFTDAGPSPDDPGERFMIRGDGAADLE